MKVATTVCLGVPCNKLLILKKKKNHGTSLLSLVPPSCMVAPNRELANTLFPFNISILSNPIQ